MALAVLPALLVCILPARTEAIPLVRNFRAAGRPGAFLLGTEAWAGGGSPAAAVDRLGLVSTIRVPVASWALIEVGPGTYDWSQAGIAGIVDAHRSGAEAVTPLAVAGSVPAFYPHSLTNPTTRAAAVAFVAAWAAQVKAQAGPVWVTIDPRVQESVFAAQGFAPDDWAGLFVDVANAIRAAAPGMRVAPHVVGDNHSTNLPGAWITTAMGAGDALAIEESVQSTSTFFSDLDWFSLNAALGHKIWVATSAFSTWLGTDPRAHGTWTQQSSYFSSLLTGLEQNNGGRVETWIQSTLADAGADSTWEHRLGLCTYNLAGEKPAAAAVRTLIAEFPPFHTAVQSDLSDFVAQSSPFYLNYFSPKDFEFLQWDSTVDFSQASAVLLTLDVDAPDGYPGFLVGVGSRWHRVMSSPVDIKPWISHGYVSVKVIIPTTVFDGIVRVRHFSISPQVNPALTDVWPPILDSLIRGRRLTLHFTDTLDPVSAETPGNYLLTNALGAMVPVYRVALNGPSGVYVYPARQDAGNYRLIVSGVKDEAGNAMIGAFADTAVFAGSPVGDDPVATVRRPLDLHVQPDRIGGSLLFTVLLGEGVRGPVDLEIFDVQGRLVHRISADPAGARSVDSGWRGESLSGPRAAPGIYFVRARAAGGEATARAFLSR